MKLHLFFLGNSRLIIQRMADSLYIILYLNWFVLKQQRNIWGCCYLMVIVMMFTGRSKWAESDSPAEDAVVLKQTIKVIWQVHHVELSNQISVSILCCAAPSLCFPVPLLGSGLVFAWYCTVYDFLPSGLLDMQNTELCTFRLTD